MELGGLLERISQRFSYRAERAGRELAVRVEPGLLVNADPQRLGQAIGNLLDNALRHGEGTIAVGAERCEGTMEVFVRDQGAGIPVSLRGREFDRFSRGDAARARGGAGLGLAIVEAIAAAHGGSARLRDDDPADVRIRLPLAGPDPDGGRVAV